MATEPDAGEGKKVAVAETCEKAFTERKRMISSNQVLTHHDPQLPIKLECDIISLRDLRRDVSLNGFVSRSLTSTERSYAQMDKEALASIWGEKKEISYVSIWSLLHINDGPSAFAVHS